MLKMLSCLRDTEITSLLKIHVNTKANEFVDEIQDQELSVGY